MNRDQLVGFSDDARLAELSEALIQPEGTAYDFDGAMLAIRTPSRAEHRLGNMLVLPEEPNRFDRARLIATWERLFPEMPDQPHFRWYGARPGAVLFPSSARHVRSISNAVMHSRDIEASGGKARCTVGYLDGPRDRKFVLRLAEKIYEPADHDWAKWRYGAYLKACDDGHGVWIVATRKRAVLGVMGLYWRDGIFRIQDLWVAPAARRQGVAGRLIEFARSTMHRQCAEPLAIVVAPNATLRTVFQKFGFSTLLHQSGFMATPAAASIASS